jgi:hypothetical protein
MTLNVFCALLTSYVEVTICDYQLHSQRDASNTGPDIYLVNTKTAEVRVLTYHKFIYA